MNFIRYNRRGNTNICEDCYSPLKWIYDGMYWIPCDTEPVLFYPESGKDIIVYHRKLLFDAKIYKKGMRMKKQVFEGLRPHALVCRKEI